MSLSTPLHGVSSQRQALFEDWLQSRGTLPRREPLLTSSWSAAELLSAPSMRGDPAFRSSWSLF